jgi:hypothetical protein
MRAEPLFAGDLCHASAALGTFRELVRATVTFVLAPGESLALLDEGPHLKAAGPDYP